MSSLLFELPAPKVPSDFMSEGHRAVLVRLFASCQLWLLRHWLQYFSNQTSANREDALTALLCVELITAELAEREEATYA